MDAGADMKTYGNKDLPAGTPDRPLVTYVLIYRNMNDYGGIQSILIRLSKFLTNKGCLVILANVEGKLLEDRKIDGIVIPYREKNAHIDIARILEEGLGDQNTIICFDPSSAAIGLLVYHEIKREFKKKVRFGVGVFHPRDFFREQEKKHVHLMNYILSLCIPQKNLFFMNDACKLSHQRFFRHSLSDSMIIPVPIDSRLMSWTASNRKVIRVCSVGRIVPFKAYNFSAPEILKFLRKVGHVASWDIYGHGSHEKQLSALIEDSQVEGLNFCGTLPLERFDETVREYDVFVGMGTAALQAAQLGVPTIVAIDQEPMQTYGYLYQIPFGNVGEREKNLPTTTIADELIRFLQMDGTERKALSDQCYKTSKKYNIEDFVLSLDELPILRSGGWSFLRFIYCKLYAWTMTNSIVRRAYRLIFRRAV